MPVYHYRALNAGGMVVRGQLHADTRHALEAYLQAAGLDVLSARRAWVSKYSFRGYQTLKVDVCTFLFHLQRMLDAGIPLLASLALLQSQASPVLSSKILCVRQRVESGDQLSTALHKSIAHMDAVTIALIHAGEQGGLLTSLLLLAARRLQAQENRRRQLLTLLLYPLLTLVLTGMALLVLLIKVVPELALFLRNLQIPAPWYTQGLLGLSGMIVTHGVTIMIVSSVLLLVLGAAYLMFPVCRLWVAHGALKVWILGKLNQKVQLSRFIHALGALYEAGVPLLDALGTSLAVVTNPVLKTGLATARHSIVQGMGLAQAFAGAGCFPPLMREMLHVGEQTGTLASALQHLQALYEQDIQATEARLLALIQPTIMVLLGAMLGWMLMAVFGVIYDNLDRMVL
ncbi:type II secretion system F family protein [Leeia oryzae]|uniref:type II secretion system F family protein n=1 Tax=Leeia oryzae TaxID=356662 RepID=UPI0003A11022|nr:type II secretion system F family protein [Leeia oryzae]